MFTIIAARRTSGRGRYWRPTGRWRTAPRTSPIRALTDPMRPAVGAGAFLHRLAIGFTANAAHAHGQNPAPADIPTQPMMGRLQSNERRDDVALVPVSQPEAVGWLFWRLRRSIRHAGRPLAHFSRGQWEGPAGCRDVSGSTAHAPSNLRWRKAVRRRAERAQLCPFQTRLQLQGLDLHSIRGCGPRSQGADAVRQHSDLQQKLSRSIVQR